MSDYDYDWGGDNDTAHSTFMDDAPARGRRATTCPECGRYADHHPNCPNHPGEPDEDEDDGRCEDCDEDCPDVPNKTACYSHDPKRGWCPFIQGDN